jgi:hypothetical protein
VSVIRWKETGQGRGGDADKSFVRNYAKRWIAITDNPADDTDTILDYSLCPKVWISAHPGNPLALCMHVDANNTAEDGDAKQWEVIAQYSTNYGTQQTANPTERPVRWTVRNNVYRRVITEDVNGVPICNVAGDPPAEPVEIDANRPTIVAQRFEQISLSMILNRVQTYNFAVNDREWQGFAKRTLRVLINYGDQITQNGFTVYPATYELEYRQETWRISYASLGWNIVVESPIAGTNDIKVAAIPSGPPQFILPSDYSSTTKTSPSNPDGKPQGRSMLAIASDAFFCKRDGYYERNFNDLGLV